jgi:hypothetical protein
MIRESENYPTDFPGEQWLIERDVISCCCLG